MAADSSLNVGNDPAVDAFEIARDRDLRILWVRVLNNHTAPVFLNIYDSPAADVTPGTDRVQPSPLEIPAGQPETIPLDVLAGRPVTFLASTTSAGTGASPGAGLEVHVAFESA